MALTSAQITTAFQNVLQREPSAAELAAWLNASNSGALSDAQIYQSIVTSAEAQNGAAAVIRVYQAAFGRVPDKAGLDQQTDSFVRGGFTINKIAEGFVVSQEFANKYNGGVLVVDDAAAVTDAFLQSLYTNVLGRLGSASEIAAWKATLTTPGSGYTKASDVLIGFSQSPEFVGKAATAVNTFLTAAAQDTAVYTGPLLDSGSTNPGQTFTLTTGVNNFTGTDSADFFDGSTNANANQTLSINDILNGAGGVDTLSATVGGGTITTGNIKNIEQFEITATGAAVFNMAGTSGYTKLSNLGSTSTLDFTNISSATVEAVVRNAGALTKLNLANGGLSGATDNFKVTVEGAITGGITVSDTAGTAALETLTIVTENADVSTALTVTDLGLAKLVVTGDKNLTITALTDATAAGATLKTIDASALTGDLSVTAVAAGTVTGGSGNDTLGGTAGNDVINGGAGNDAITIAAGNDNITAGAGNDTVTVGGNLTVDDTIAGGDGTDTISISAAVAVGQAANVSGIETITLTGADVTQDMDAFSATEVVRVNTNSADNFVVNDAGDQIVTLGIGGGVASTTLTRKVDSTTNALTINLGTSAAGVTATAVTIDNEETVTINSGGGANKITTLTAADVTKLVITGNQSLDLDDNAIGGGTLLATIDASAFTGTALAINATNSTKNITYTHGTGTISVTTGGGNDTVVGGIGADNIVGGNGNDVLTGGVGNDTIDGGAGNDVLTGGDGEDSITAGAGNDSIDAGAGNDTIIFGTNLATADTINGGDGTDRITFEVSSTIAPTLSNIEQASVTFGATSGGAFNSGNASTITSYTLSSTNNNTTGTVTNIATGAQVIVSDANTDAVTLDTADGATLTVTYRATGAGTTTITDAKAIVVNAAGTTTNAAANALVLDDVDTTSLTVNGASGAFTLATGNVTGTDKLASLTVATTTAVGTATVGTVVDGDSLTALTVNAVNANATIGAVGGTGTAEALATVVVSASGGATANVGNITADTTDSTTDNAMVLTVTSDVGSTVTMGTVNNEFGTINATLSGAGAITIGAFTAADLLTFDASATSGAVSLDMTSVVLGGTVLFGSGAATYQASRGNDTVTFGANNATTDTITLSNTAGGMVSITNFKTGTTNGDLIKLDSSAIGLPTNGNSAAIAAGSLTVKEAAAATVLAAADEVVVLTGAQFATAALAEVAIEGGGSRALTFGAANAIGDDVLVAWSDGSNSYIGSYNAGNAATTLDATGTMTVLVTLVGVDVSTAGTLVTANLELVA